MQLNNKNETTQLKNGQRPKIDISPKKTNRWQTGLWKNAQYHELLEECKSKLQWGTTSHQPEWPPLTSQQIADPGEGMEKKVPSSTGGGNVFFGLVFFFFLVLLFRATPMACGSSQARGPIRAVAAGLLHSHRYTGLEVCLWPTLELTATPDP